jgi:hypothetical protein
MLQIVYSSVLNPDCGPDDLLRIRRQSELNNGLSGLTGLLACFNGHFVGLLEGSTPVVLAMLERIATDRRHDHLCILREAEISEHRFIGWHFSVLADHGAGDFAAIAQHFALTLSRRMARYEDTRAKRPVGGARWGQH